MNTGAWVMFAVGAIGLWGGLVWAVINYFRGVARENANAEEDRTG